MSIKVFLLLTFCLVNVPSCTQESVEEYPEVSMISVIANIGSYYDQKISIKGYYKDIGPVGTILYFSKEKMKTVSTLDGILVDRESVKSIVTPESCSGRRVMIKARVKKLPEMPFTNNAILVDIVEFRDISNSVDKSCTK